MSGSIDGDASALLKLLERVPQFVLMVDLDQRVRYINRVEPGYVRSEVIGLEVRSVLVPGSEDAFSAAMASVLADGQPVEYEVEVAHPDRRFAWYRSTMTPFRQGDETTGVILVAEDITELRLAREESETLRRLLPICSWCDRIQAENGGWERIEAYVSRKEEAKVSHGLCEDCFERQMADLDGPGTGDERPA
jgi:PAS domain S-box-containing protein